MKTRIIVIALTLFLCSSCNSNSRQPVTMSSSRVYHGTASVGDFMTITIDSNAQTIAYTDLSNDTSGTATFTVNADGTYTLNDPSGNLLSAYEVPNYAILIQAAKAGPDANAPALITAVESGAISLATFEGQSYNYMQFRTAAGGVEVGSVSVSGSGKGSISSYWPYGAFNPGNQGSSPFHAGSIDMSKAQVDSSGTFLTVPDPDGKVSDYVFGTANGIFAVDTQNGAILGLATASSPNFDSSTAGTYQAIFYQKINATTGQGNVETGTASLGNATLVITTAGGVTITDSSGNQLAQGTLVPIAKTSYLYGTSGELSTPCYGVFTFRVSTANSQQDFFAAFMGQAMLFGSFTGNLGSNSSTYNYFYGVGLKPAV